mmetsp:Transcript_25854/g.97367  ORF Transcript_25854/g.97367 Transcript_25854/m.97367 type:complete len:303 (+) Transcript_25854:393-1301(+)
MRCSTSSFSTPCRSPSLARAARAPGTPAGPAARRMAAALRSRCLLSRPVGSVSSTTLESSECMPCSPHSRMASSTCPAPMNSPAAAEYSPFCSAVRACARASSVTSTSAEPSATCRALAHMRRSVKTSTALAARPASTSRSAASSNAPSYAAASAATSARTVPGRSTSPKLPASAASDRSLPRTCAPTCARMRLTSSRYRVSRTRVKARCAMSNRRPRSAAPPSARQSCSVTPRAAISYARSSSLRSTKRCMDVDMGTSTVRTATWCSTKASERRMPMTKPRMGCSWTGKSAVLMKRRLPPE